LHGGKTRLEIPNPQETLMVLSLRRLKTDHIDLLYQHRVDPNVAYALGFSEATHFNSLFKKRTQVSPTTFRQWLILKKR
jgi:AraC-like DNA-binding protein